MSERMSRILSLGLAAALASFLGFALAPQARAEEDDSEASEESVKAKGAQKATAKSGKKAAAKAEEGGEAGEAEDEGTGKAESGEKGKATANGKGKANGAAKNGKDSFAVVKIGADEVKVARNSELNDLKKEIEDEFKLALKAYETEKKAAAKAKKKFEEPKPVKPEFKVVRLYLKTEAEANAVRDQTIKDLEKKKKKAQAAKTKR